MVALNIRDLGEERTAALEAEARSRGVSVSELVCQYIDEGIGRGRADRARQAWIAESREGQAFEAEHLAKNGPSPARYRKVAAGPFRRLRRDLAAAAAQPTEDVDLRELLLDRGTEPMRA